MDAICIEATVRKHRNDPSSIRKTIATSLSMDRNGAYVEKNETAIQARLAELEQLPPQARGSLYGVPISVKDLYGVDGYATRAGSPKLLPTDSAEALALSQTGTFLKRFIDAGAVVVGKTHTVEFAFGGIGTNPHYQTPRNPSVTSTKPEDQRAPGGSSSGAGVSVVEGSAMIALGTDTAGSVRIPAAWTGCVGFKSSARRWAKDGVVPLSYTLDTMGFLTTTAANATYVFDAIDSVDKVPSPDPASVRIGVPRNMVFLDCSAGVAEAVESALRTFSVISISDCELPFAEDANALFRQGGPASAEVFHFLTKNLPASFDELDPNVKSRIGDASSMTAFEYLERCEKIQAWEKHFVNGFEGCDVMAMPTVANTPPLLSDLTDRNVYAEQNLLCLRNTGLANYLGLCAISIPVGTDAAGMPVGLQLMMPHGSDRALLSIAQALESQL